MKKHLSWTNVILSLLVAVLLMSVFWGQFDPRVIALFVGAMSFAEIFIQIRWRLSVVCPHCGFDPVLYQKDRTMACDKVVNVLKRKKASGEYLLKSTNPFENLPKRKPEGSLVSRPQTPRLSKQI